MTCQACRTEQAKGYGTYIRVGTANVFVVGCEYHLGLLFVLLKKGAEKDESDKSIEKANKIHINYETC